MGVRTWDGMQEGDLSAENMQPGLLSTPTATVTPVLEIATAALAMSDSEMPDAPEWARTCTLELWMQTEDIDLILQVWKRHAVLSLELASGMFIPAALGFDQFAERCATLGARAELAQVSVRARARAKGFHIMS